jgi:competence protein ComEA
MRRSEPRDETASLRLAALGLPAHSHGWVPEQPAPGPPTPPQPALDPPASPQSAPALAGVADRIPMWAPEWLRAAATSPSAAALLSLAAVCVLCVGVTGFLLLHRPGTAADVAAPLPTLPAALPAPTPSGIVVDVGGRVRRPGLVTLSPGARIADALDAAGGAIRGSDLRLVDLAARVSDGELLLIGISGAAPGGSSAGGAAGASAGPVNLNTATVDQLDALPGIGPVLAQRILDWRAANGGFRSVEDLNEVSGIGEATYADLAPLVAV